MRRYLLIVLMFIPAVAAWMLFQGWSREGPAAIRRAQESGVQSSAGSAAEALTGFEGKGTFYRHLARVRLGSREISYTSAFYHLAHWKREGDDTFVIDDLLVVQNPKPKSSDDLESLLKISNAEPSQVRKKKLEDARARYNSLTAVHARASGGKNVTNADRFRLSRGVEASIPNKRTDLPPYHVTANEADLGLKEGSLNNLTMVGSFQITTPEYNISGAGMEALGSDSRLVIKEKPLIKSIVAKGESRAPRTLMGGGPLVWLPDDEIPGEPRGILDRTRFDFGHLEVQNGVNITLDQLELSGRRLKARVGDLDGASHPGRLDSFRLDGDVVVKTSRGQIKGDEARVDLDADGGATVWVEGRRVNVDWEDLGRKSTENQAPSLKAVASGELRIDVPGQKARTEEPLRITMTENVALDILDKKEPMRFTGENLVVELTHILLGSDEPAGKRQAWRFQQAVMRGKVEGSGNGFGVKTPKLTVSREYEEAGALRREILQVTGPAELTRPGGLGRTLQSKDAFTTVAAKRRITYWIPASPFAESRALAVGHVSAFETGAPDQNRRLNAEWLELVLLPDNSARSDRTKSLEATGSVDFVDEKGSRVTGDRVWVNRPNGYAEATGSPARLAFVDSKKQVQSLKAGRIEFRANDARLVASGGFEGNLVFRGAVLTSDKSSESAGQAETWEVSGLGMHAIFGGRLPLTTREEAVKDPVELLEINLTGDVRVENDQQLLTGESLRYDFRTDSGTMTGQPARLVSYRDADGVRLKDWVEAPRILTQPEWTLLEGSCVAQLNIRRERARRRRDPSNWEALRVECSQDVMIRKDLAVFNGRCILERGVVATGGLRLEADQVTAAFEPSTGTRPRPQKLKRLQATGNVQIARDKLRGQGEVLDFDYIAKQAIVTSDKKPCRMWMDGDGFESTGRSVRYDLENDRITVIKVFAAPKSTEGNN